MNSFYGLYSYDKWTIYLSNLLLTQTPEDIWLMRMDFITWKCLSWEISKLNRGVWGLSISLLLCILCWKVSINVVLVYNFMYAETIQRLMLDLNTMKKQNLGMKGVILHLLVLPRMKFISLMQSIWLIQDVVC